MRGAVIQELLGPIGQGKPTNALQVGFAPAWSQAFAGERREGQDEVGKHDRVQRENVLVEVKELAGLDGKAIEMAGAENERPGRIVQAAGAFTIGDRREDFGVRAGVTAFAGTLGVSIGGAFRDAGDAAENGAERTAQNVGGFAWREEKRFARDKFKAQRKKVEPHTALLYRQLKGGFLYSMATQASPAIHVLAEEMRRKPPGLASSAQYNWITERFEVRPEQLDLDMPVPDDVVLPHDNSVTLLATENGAQLLVAGFGLYIGKKGERIVIKQGGKVCAQVPFMRAQEVIIGSRGVSFSSDLLEELCSRGIRVAVLSSSGKPVALITSPLLSATVETRRQQLAAFSNERGANFCRWIVAGKLHNQEKLLRYFGKSREGTRREELETTASKLRNFRRDALAVTGSTADEVRPTLMGLEGIGGRMYWQRIGAMLPDELGFQGRRRPDSERQGPGDAVNAALNYGYGILYAHVWGAAMNAGLEPFAGFMHVDRSGKPSMVLDLVEEFRQPVADRAILTWLNKGGKLTLVKGMLDGESRENVAARVLLRLNTKERHRGKEHEVRSIVQMQARRAASAMRGLRDYRPFAFQW